MHLLFFVIFHQLSSVVDGNNKSHGDDTWLEMKRINPLLLFLLFFFSLFSSPSPSLFTKYALHMYVPKALLWCMMIDYCPNKVKRHTGTEYNRKTMGCLVFQRAHARIENCINCDTSKLKVINNFVISTLIMGINSYSEDVIAKDWK